MKRVLIVILILGATACAALSKDEYADQKSDINGNKEFMKTDEDTQMLGETLMNFAEAIKEEARHPTLRDDQSVEYFFKKLFRKKIVRQIGKAGAEIGKKFLGQKAQEIIQQKMKERGHYTLDEAGNHSNYLFAISEEVERLGKDLIAKRPDLYGNSVQKETPVHEKEEPFVKDYHRG
uniref:Putative conserved secreted protein n=1 Tax=Ixodes scapularis TaxID=6945 RepID=A0A4D5RTA3_IXOSC